MQQQEPDDLADVVDDLRALPIRQPGQPVNGKVYCGYMEGGIIGQHWVVRRLPDGTFVREKA